MGTAYITYFSNLILAKISWHKLKNVLKYYNDGQTLLFSGSGCGLVGRAVASYTRRPRFEPSHRQTLYKLLTWEDENKKEAGIGQLNNITIFTHQAFPSVFGVPFQWLAIQFNVSSSTTILLGNVIEINFRSTLSSVANF